MKLLIAGSRTGFTYQDVQKAVFEAISEWDCKEITEVVCGMALGVDSHGFRFANARDIPVKEFPADWNGESGIRAGIERNIEMGDYCDAAVILIHNNSSGSTHMKNYINKLGKPLYLKEHSTKKDIFK